MKENRLAPAVTSMIEGSELPVERALKHLERTSRCWPMVLSDTIIFNMASVSIHHDGDAVADPERVQGVCLSPSPAHIIKYPMKIK